MTSLFFAVAGKPIGKARARVTRTGHSYTPQRTKDQETTIRFEAMAALTISKVNGTDTRIPLDSPVELHIVCRHTIPKSWSKARRAEAASGACMTTPDVDNVAKLVMDALNGMLWNDDRQVVHLCARREWAERACTEVEVVWS